MYLWAYIDKPISLEIQHNEILGTLFKFDHSFKKTAKVMYPSGIISTVGIGLSIPATHQ